MTGRRLLLALLLSCVAASALVAYVRRPEHAFLVAHDGAAWIRAERPFELRAREPAMETASFRHRFTVPESLRPEDAVLQVQGLRAFRLIANGRIVGEGGPQEATWRYPRSFDLTRYLVPGANELRIDVQNDRGLPLLLAYGSGLGIATGPGWEAPGPGGTWRPAVPADAERQHSLSREFPSAWQGLRATWGLLLAAFALGTGASLACSRAQGAWRLRPAHVRWLVLAALSAIGIHNLTLVDILAGFDAPFHFEYIRYVVATQSVPLANQGWQSFQPPLFYFLAALPYSVVAQLASVEAAMLAVRVLVLVCTLGLVEMVYRAARTAFPEREDLQSIATVTGGFLPMTVYMSQYVSNEPLGGVLTAALVVSVFRLLADASPRLERRAIGLGILFGLALLAKVTAALLLPLLVAALVRSALRLRPGLRNAFEPLLGFAAASGAVAGWYFVRNWLVMGSFYFGGWDASRGVPWIQDPGYRIPEDLLTFGASLQYPIYALFSGIWDGLYSTFWLDGSLGSFFVSIAAPPWHYPYVVACALLALPLTAAGLAGALRSLRVPRGAAQETLLFATLAVALYLAAIFSLYLWLPVFSTVKSSYTLGLAPCYGLLFATGFDLLPRRPAVRALLTGYLAAWLAFVFRAYFS